MRSIDILLATYNGADYLDSQILSLLSQTHKNWKLIIHDDGSTDNTLNIIRRFQQNDERIILIDDGVQFRSAAYNFLHLLKFSQSELIIFCDQDDIWFENKLELLSKEFCDQLGPQAVFCNGFAYCTETGILNDKITLINPQDLNEQLFINAGIQGCSVMFNRELKYKINKVPGYVVMHDHFLTLAIVCFAKLTYVDKNLMLYRQFHQTKATANIDYRLSKRIKSYFVSDVPVIDKNHKKATRSFFETYRSELGAEQIVLFNAYFSYSERTLVQRVWIVVKYKFTLYNSIFALVVKTIMRRPIN